MHGEITLVRVLLFGLFTVFAVLGALFGGHRYGYRYGYHSPLAGCCGCCAVIIMLPIAIYALRMLAKMYGAFMWGE